jgi:hypothetical protein
VTILSSMQRFNVSNIPLVGHATPLRALLTIQVGRLAVASLNYFHRKAYLQLLEKRGAPISPNVPE